jgi:hypothetical protein
LKILNIDIETRPALAYVFDLKTRYISPANIVEPKSMLCFAAKWVDEPRVFFYSTWGDGRAKMIGRVWQLLDEADAVLHYNGQSFDVPHINTEIAQERLLPPSPFKQIDLYRTATRHFGLMSYRLDEVAKTFGTARKVSHEGIGLWHKVLQGDVAAQADMETYNRGDVWANEDLYNLLLPWITQHPNVALYDGQARACPKCGGVNLQKRGYAYTGAGVFQRYRCNGCGSWPREAKRMGTTELREIA